MKTTRTLLCAVLLAMPVTAYADTPPSGGMTDKDTTKLSDADIQVIAHQHAVNQLEIEMGKLAQKNGSSDAAKEFGAMLVKDHTMADKQLTEFAKKHGLATIPPDTTMTEMEKKDISDKKSKLKSMKGADFDRELASTEAAAHERELAKVEANANLVENKDLAMMLKDMKPVLQRHEDAAKALEKQAPSS